MTNLKIAEVEIRRIDCPKCKGSGIVGIRTQRGCSKCRGKGTLEVSEKSLALVQRPIRLADVLLAIKNKDKILEKQLKDTHGLELIKGNSFGQFLMYWRAFDSQIRPNENEFWNLYTYCILFESLCLQFHYLYI